MAFVAIAAAGGGCGGESVTAEEAEGSTGGEAEVSTTTTTTIATSGLTTSTTTADSSWPWDTGDTGGAAPPQGTCIGFFTVGHIASVLTRADANVEAAMCSPEPDACGGDVVGTWNVETYCGFDTDTNPFGVECPDSTYTITSMRPSGTITFEEDRSYTDDSTLVLDAELVVPDVQACFATDCEGLGELFGDDPAVFVVCGPIDDACMCLLEMTAPGNAGTYETDAGILALTTSKGGTNAPMAYCVEGDRLQRWETVSDHEITGVACDSEVECEAALGDAYDGYACATMSAGARVPANERALSFVGR